MTGILEEARLEQAQVSSHARFVVMDGLRGVSALAVVLVHSYVGGGYVPNAQLAVDLFFILSGFVIAYSYERRLSGTMTKRDFLAARFVRLYPMLLIGSLGGIIIALIHNKTNPSSAFPLDSIFISGTLSVFVLPYFGASMGLPIFSFNPPIWSLFFEAIANIAYAFLLRQLSIGVLIAIVGVSVVAIGMAGPLDGGTKQHVLLGLPRVSAGFFGGVLLYKLWKKGVIPNIPGNIFVLSGILLVIFCAPIKIGGWLYAPVFAILWLVVLAAINGRTTWADRYSEFLGLVSYPVYLIHWLTLYVFAFIGGKIGLMGDRYWILVTMHLAAIPFIGFLVAKYYETPTRLLLTRALQHKR